MKKVVLILSFILVSLVSFAQRQRTTAVFDGDTTTRPKTGFYGIGIRSNRFYLIPENGNNRKILEGNTHFGTSGQFLKSNSTANFWANIGISDVTSLQSSLNAKFATPTGLTTNYLTKWNGSVLANCQIFDNGTNVGIGTTSPDIGSTGNKVLSISGVFTRSRLQLQNTDGVSIGSVAGTVQFIGGTVGIADITASSITSVNSGFLAFSTNNSGGYSEKVRILPNGNVGIGTTSPSKKLDVNGEVILKDLLTISSTVTNEGGQITLKNPTNYTKSFAIDNYQDSFRIINDTDGLTALSVNSNGSVAIGSITANSSSILDITSTTKGVLLSRMTTTQINAISSPANGLMVYNTTLNKLCVYENGTWKQVTTTNM